MELRSMGVAFDIASGVAPSITTSSRTEASAAADPSDKMLVSDPMLVELEIDSESSGQPEVHVATESS